jgi:hypothetical protein
LDYGFQYKAGINELVYFRYGLSKIGIKHDSFLPALSSTFSNQSFEGTIKMNIGIEKRKEISGSVSWFCGLDVIEQFIFQRYRIDNPNLTEEDRKSYNYTNSLGLGLPLGVIFKLNKKIHPATEIEPELIYMSHVDEITQSTLTNKRRRFEFSKENIKFSIIYKIR